MRSLEDDRDTWLQTDSHPWLDPCLPGTQPARIELRGFGTFELRHRKARTGRNPRTGEPVEVPPWDVPVFKPPLHLRRRMDRASGESGMKSR